jgi:hypothetical protein
MNYLTTAKDEIANGNYTLAHTRAQEAYAKTNESLNDALRRQEELENVVSPNCGFPRMCI